MPYFEKIETRRSQIRINKAQKNQARLSRNNKINSKEKFFYRRRGTRR